jgi:hypothetical protein
VKAELHDAGSRSCHGTRQRQSVLYARFLAASASPRNSSHALHFATPSLGRVLLDGVWNKDTAPRLSVPTGFI